MSASGASRAGTVREISTTLVEAAARERVQEILEHRGRGERVQHLRASLAAQARARGGLFGSEGREPLVPQQDRQTERGAVRSCNAVADCDR